MRVLIMLCCALPLAACSDPECGAGELKVGVTCRRLTRDGGVPDAGDAQEGASGKVSADGAQADGARDAESNDAGVSSTGDAAATQTGDAAVDANTANVASCGDGLLNGAELCDSRIAAGEAGACPTSASCKGSNACLVGRLEGAAETCDALCQTEPRTACESGDGCCPSGCNSGNDKDCSPSCGNGVLDTGETCEPNVGAGCPTSCALGDGCHPTALTGSAANCNAACVSSAITTPSGATKDGCCPGGGATFANDQDCPGCGDHVLQAPELCDGNCPTTCDDGNPCTTNVLNGGASTCNAACSFPTIAASTAAKDGLCCPAGSSYAMDLDCAGCGNGIVEAGEQCDSGSQSVTPPCGQSCQYIDLPATYGDDRPGYFRCGSLQTPVCSPGQRCVLTIYSPGSIPDQKYSPHCEPLDGATAGCDGPEDCSPQSPVCWDNADVGNHCSTGYPTADSDYSTACHVAANCPAGETCRMTFGTCS
jgi:hypothetical protein